MFKLAGSRCVSATAPRTSPTGGLVLIRKLFDRLGLAGWIDARTGKEKASAARR